MLSFVVGRAVLSCKNRHPGVGGWGLYLEEQFFMVMINKMKRTVGRPEGRLLLDINRSLENLYGLKVVWRFCKAER